MSVSCRTQCIDLLCKSIDWFLYDRDFRNERVNLVDALTTKHYQDKRLWNLGMNLVAC